MAEPLLKLESVTKSFGATRALGGVDFSVFAGEVHALIGENGAGKSTLMKIVSGALHPDAGTIFYNGKPFRMLSPRQSRHAGIAMIYQELTLASHLSVAANMTLGVEKNRWGFFRDAHSRAHATLCEVGCDHIDPRMLISSLSAAEKQLVEIARALASDARLLILDEPTSSLSSNDTQKVFQVIGRLRAKGVAIIYISHFLEEVQLIADRYTVLRDGVSVAHGSMSGTLLSSIVQHMVGRPIAEFFPKSIHSLGSEALRVCRINDGEVVQDCSFVVRKGEILGIAGLIGSGRTELLRCLFGLNRMRGGTVTVNGCECNVMNHTPQKGHRNGIDFLSENRKEEGLAVGLSLLCNATLSSLRSFVKFFFFGFLDRIREQGTVRTYFDRLQVKYRSINQKVKELSGGNQQKVALARMLILGSEVLLLDEPTRGIDIASKTEIYREIGELAAQGKAIVLVSSYIPELLGICDSLGVMHRGRLSPVLPIAEWSEEKIMAWATTGKSGIS